MKLDLHSIASKLVVGGVTAVVIPLIVVGYLSFSKSQHALLGLSQHQVQDIATDLARMTRTILDIEMDRAQALAAQQPIVDAAAVVKTSGIEASEDIADAAFRSLKRQFSVMGDQYQGIFRCCRYQGADIHRCAFQWR